MWGSTPGSKVFSLQEVRQTHVAIYQSSSTVLRFVFANVFAIDCVAVDCVAVDCVAVDCVAVDCVAVDCVAALVWHERSLENAKGPLLSKRTLSDSAIRLSRY
jgi:hypothetical protein